MKGISSELGKIAQRIDEIGRSLDESAYSTIVLLREIKVRATFGLVAIVLAGVAILGTLRHWF